ncbi:MAG: hypothetical protein PHD20_04630 [Clostridia bacterium]|nr:hypothetical protein [Clostridia bacterium]
MEGLGGCFAKLSITRVNASTVAAFKPPAQAPKPTPPSTRLTVPKRYLTTVWQ